MMRLMRRSSGFTLIEIITVIAIFAIFASFVMPSLGRARQRAFKSKTQAQIAAIELALTMYQADVGRYPDSLSIVGLEQDDGAVGWDGPYIELKDQEVAGQTLIDSWGQAFEYTSNNGLKVKPEIRSLGLNPEDPSDDISNKR